MSESDLSAGANCQGAIIPTHKENHMNKRGLKNQLKVVVCLLRLHVDNMTTKEHVRKQTIGYTDLARLNLIARKLRLLPVFS
jgi:hypothetical protein